MILKFSHILAIIAAVLLSGCALGARPPGTAPSLVPTLAVSVLESKSASSTPAPQETISPLPNPEAGSDTPSAAVSATLTITPWPKNTETPGPSPTASNSPTWTRVPTRTIGPTRTPTITNTPTITFTPTPPPPLINLIRPGLLSKLISPIQMEMNAFSGADNIVSIELIGEDGRLISRQLLRRDYPHRRYWIAPQVPFEIPVAAEMARLQVHAEDEFGRTEALTSVDVILLAVGRNEINPSALTEDPYLVRSPEEGDTVSGGTLVIQGLARPVNDSPLLIELITESNRVMSVKQLIVPSPSGALSHTPFSVEIPYKVSGPTPVRLTIRQEGSRIPGTVALSSQLIVLAP